MNSIRSQVCLRRLPQLVTAILCAGSLFFATDSASAEGLNKYVAQRVAAMSGKTLFFRNNTDKIPQLEYFRPDGSGFVWSAALGDKVVPIRWTVDNGNNGRGWFCMLFKAADVGEARDMRLCDSLDVIAGGLKESRDGDVYGLTRTKRMSAPLPRNASGFGEVDKILGRK